MKTIPFSKFNCVESLLLAAKKFGVSVEVLDEKSKLMIFSKNNINHFVHQHVTDINSHMASMLTNNKFLTKKILEKNGIPVPFGYKDTTYKKSLERIKKGEIRFPLVIKPVRGSQGSAVTVDIKNNHCMKGAIEEVYGYNISRKNKEKEFLIEEYVNGGDYRFLVLDGKVLTVTLRKPAYIVGDGKSTIDELVDDYNSQPGVAKNQPLCPIPRDYEFNRNLTEQTLCEESVIEKGKTVFLRKNANVSTGGRSFECHEGVNSRYMELMEKIVKLFGIRFCAIDIIAEDIKRFEKFKIIELNDKPGFDIHEAPFKGRPFRVAEHLVNLIFA